MAFQATVIVRMAILPIILALTAGSGLLAAEPAPTGGDAVKRAPANPEKPTYIILNSPNNPADMAGLLKGIPPGSRIVNGPQAEERPGVPTPKDSKKPWSYVVSSVKISGKVVDELADLAVEMEINLQEDDPVWIPIRLDGKAFTAIREGERDLLPRSVDQKQWEVQLEQKGLHRIRVEFKVFLKSILDRSVLDLDIPNAATTSLELDIPQRVVDASAGPNEPVDQKSLGPGKGYRLVTHLPPRSKLDLSWRKESGSDAERQPLISVQGEIALNAELESLRAHSSWLVRCVRGSAQSLEITLDPQDEVREVLLDDQVPRYETERVGRVTQLKIPLAEPMTPGSTKRLVFSTRRANAPGSNSTVSFKGFAFSHAKDQSGAIALFPGVNLWADFTLVQSVLQINASEMPADLRARPGTPLAFQFLDQPFELKLSIEPSPPQASAESRTVLRLGPDVVHQVTWIDLQWIRGRLFEVEIGIPGDLKLTACGPQELIEPLNPASNGTAEKLVGDANRTRILKIRLSAQAMDQKKITIRLEGQQPYRPSDSTQLDLFQPRGMIEIDSRFALFGSRELSIETRNGVDPLDSRLDQRFAPEEDARDWPWPGVVAGTDRPSLILGTQGLPKFLPLKVSRNPRSISQDVALSARLTRRGIDVQQQTVCEVRHGIVKTVDLLIPDGIGDTWQVNGLGSNKGEEIERLANGERRYRLTLPDSASDRFTLRLRYPIKFRSELDSKTRQSSSIPWIAVVGAASKGVQLNLAAEPGIHLEATSPEWSLSTDERPPDPPGSSQVISSTYRANPPMGRDLSFKLNAWASEQASLPTTVSPRAFIRTTYGFDRQLHNKAWFSIENHGPHLTFEPPPDCRLLLVRIEGRRVIPEEIETKDSHRACRIVLPGERVNTPIVLEIEYDSAIGAADRTWQAPRLLDDARVLETSWQIILPWNLALIGSPAGWSDDNQWFWDNSIWKRRPARGIPAMLARLGVAPAATANGDGQGEDVGNDSQNYLFSHVGDVHSIQIRIASRSWLVGVCSGVLLLIGFALMLLPKSMAKAVLGVIVVLGLAAGALLHPSTLILAAQSSIIGIILTFMGFSIQYAIESRRPAPRDDRDSIKAAAPFAPGSTMTRQVEARPADVGSDESTAIRVRVASTMEYRAKATSTEEPERTPGSKVELAR